jgi:hypothetical protein
MILDDHKKHQIIASVIHANAFINISDHIGPPFWEKEVKMKGNQFIKAAEQKYKVLATALFDIEGGGFYLKALEDAEELVQEIATLPWFSYHDVVQIIKTYKHEQALQQANAIKEEMDNKDK